MDVLIAWEYECMRILFLFIVWGTLAIYINLFCKMIYGTLNIGMNICFKKGMLFNKNCRLQWL